MATLIDKVKVKAGRLIKVVNTSRPPFSSAANFYVSVWVEDADGSNKRCLLFTPTQIQAAEHRAKKNKEDLTKKSFFTRLFE